METSRRLSAAHAHMSLFSPLPKYRRHLALSLLCIVLSLIAPIQVQAVDKFWVCNSDTWDNTSCWSLTAGGAGGAGLPATNEDVFLIQSDSIDRIVTYIHPTSAPTLASLTLDAIGTGSMTLQQDQDSFNSTNVFVGNDGSGSYIQNTGSNTIGNALYLGFNATGDGAYSLGTSGSAGSLTAFKEVIGNDGVGTFNQIAGTNTISNTFHVGANTSGNGTYNLISGSLTTNGGDDIIGLSGTGMFNQIGGTHSGGSSLIIGAGSTGNGTYILGGAGFLNKTIQTIGASGSGAFIHSGGRNQVSTLRIGSNTTGNGTYELSNTGDLDGTTAYVGRSGAGAFTQSGGTHTLSSPLYIGYRSIW